jgi:hypothetical protein
MLYGIDQTSCEVACAIVQVLYRSPPIRSASHERMPTGRNADLDESDAGIGIAVLRSRTHDDDGAGRAICGPVAAVDLELRSRAATAGTSLVFDVQPDALTFQVGR